MIDGVSPLSLAWLSGLLEGEGAFDLHKGRSPRVRVSMTDRDTVQRAATIMESNVRVTIPTNPALQPMWHAEISGAKAVEVMEAILPYMGSRRSNRIATVLGQRAAISTPEVSTRGIAGPRLAIGGAVADSTL